LYDADNKSRLVTATPFYYSWVILAVGTFGGIMTRTGQPADSGGQSPQVAVFGQYEPRIAHAAECDLGF
jgi:hypothetical protein